MPWNDELRKASSEFGDEELFKFFLESQKNSPGNP